MISPSLGLGLCSFGDSIYGFGSPGETNSSTAKLFLKTDGTRGNVGAIDPLTGDHILDANGNPVGDNSVNMMMYIALFTIKNSSALLNFGIDISNIKTVTDNTSLKFQLAVNDAVKHLIDKKLIKNVSTDVKKINANTPGALQVTVNWTDVTNGERNITKLLG